MNFTSLMVAAVIVAAGIGSAGYFVGDGIAERTRGARVISVKGLSEKEVPASIAIWDIAYSATGNELPAVDQQLAASTSAVIEFLRSAGFAEKDMAVQPPSVRDLSLEPREKDVPLPPERYRAQRSVLLRTSKVDAIKPALANLSQLITKGILLSGRCHPEYIYNQLNEIKPGMIEEATKNARIAGEQFSRDSQTKLGKLKSAAQGWFQIENRDAATPERKVVRVVVDVEYEVN
jgi:hypothetical protein